MIRSYRYRVFMSDRIGRSFEMAMMISNQIYNAALDERIGAWRKRNKSITKFDQMKSLTQIRADDPEMARFAVSMLRTPLVQVDEAFRGFFSRLGSRGKYGYPRFRSLKRLRSFGFNQMSGWFLDGKKLRIKGLPSVGLKMHRPLIGEPLKLTIKRDGRGRWFAIIVVRLPDIMGPVKPGAIGLDLGIESIVTDSDGVHYGKVSPERSNSIKRSKVERQLARCRLGSKRRKKTVRHLARLRQREADARRTRHFQLASKIVSNGPGIIVIEKLTVKNMSRSRKGTIEKPGVKVAAKAGLNRSLQDAGLTQFVNILIDKAESAGRLVIAVNPKNTSQDCSGCGIRVKKTLRQRKHSCLVCGLDIHRDHNAARNVLYRGVVARSWV